MAKHLISVCVFCFLCATHSCESHAEEHEKHKGATFLENGAPPVLQPIRIGPDNDDNISRSAHLDHNSNNLGNSISNKELDDDYLKKIFEKYSDGKSMTMEGFTKVLKEADLVSHILHKQVERALSLRNVAALISNQETDNLTESNFTCINYKEILKSLRITNNSVIDENTIRSACPAILFNTFGEMCKHTANKIEDTDARQILHISASVWFYSFLAVLVISACGVLGLAVIPIMQKHYYQPLLQFLVALAVGTLAGDALLHLLPHAMSTGHTSHHNHDDESHSNHDENMWKGFVAMLGLVFFFVMEKFIVIVVKWRKSKQMKHQLPSNMKVMKEGLQASAVGEKQCKHKYSSMPFCYDTAIAMIDKNNSKEDYPVFRLVGGQDDNHHHNDTASTLLELNASAELDSFKKLETNQNHTECPIENSTNCTDINKMLDNNEIEEYTIILREHENRHHGHSHTHGHVHAAPKNLSSVAWMVIMGDGLHNFTDGMAIGAAFSSSVAGGFSTAVAVFCHELPHELGDFAMLLKAGMSMKQALFYNIISSVLCLCGNLVGVWLGNTEYASSWVFAVAAGTFIYIALVDMIPELSNGHEDTGTLFQCILQLCGLLLGFGIMTCIAVYEHDLKHIFNEPV